AQVSIPGYGTQSWAFDARTGLWTLTSGGPRVQVANVVVQTVRYKHAVVSHSAGTTVPSARPVGKGPVEVLSGSAGGSGMAAAGAWPKPHLDQLPHSFHTHRSPLAFHPRPP